MNEHEIARRALARLNPLTAAERAQIAHYRPTPGGAFVVRDAPQDLPLLARAYHPAILIHVTREDMPPVDLPPVPGTGLLIVLGDDCQ